MDLIEYVIDNRHTSFEKLPFNEVDALLYAQLSYYNFSIFDEKICLKDINKNNISEMTETRNLYEEDEILLKAVINSERYNKSIAFNYVSRFDMEIDEQFAAVTFLIDDGSYIVSFRGTDGTITGWKEDLSLAYKEIIPAQDDAARYMKVLNDIKDIKDVKVVGHSKGGNLAFFAAVNARKDIKDKISGVYNFDGPGFNKNFYTTVGYDEIKDRLYKFIPRSSAVGRLMRNSEYYIVDSTAEHFMQHWGFSWVIQNNKFKRVDNTDNFSNSVADASDEFLEKFPKKDRQEAIDYIFDILLKSNCFYMDDIFKHKEQILSILKTYYAYSKKNRSKVVAFLVRYMYYIVKNYVKINTINTKNKFSDYIKNVRKTSQEKILTRINKSKTSK